MKNKKAKNSNSEKPVSLIEKYKAIQAIGHEVAVPWEHWRLLGTPKKVLEVWGTSVCIGEDWGSLQECREAVEFYVKQLGGSVKWDK